MIPLTRSVRAVAGVLAVAALAVGCGSPQKTTTSTASTNAPDWIDNPQIMADEGNNVVLYGVGSASFNPNRAVQRRMATNRARAELAATLGVLVQGMVVSYMDTNRDFYDMDSASSTEYYQDISRQVTQEYMVGTREEQIYRDPISNEMYALVSLDLDDVLNTYKSKMVGTFEREATRRRIKTNMMEFQAQMDEQLDKLRQMDAEALESAFIEGDG